MNLLPLAWLYGAAVGLKNEAYRRSILRPRSLSQPVISIGNLSIGGAGKTPLVIHLARLLADAAVPVDVLSRGYGRVSSATARVDPGAPDASSRFGDEPVLIAESAGCPVYVGASRYRAGLLAEQEAPRLHLLDDGFQHRKLYRHVDIVVLHRSDFNGRLLPSGRLREPLASLQRASLVVLREEDAELEPELRRRGITAPVWKMRRDLVLPEALGATVAFCGIARPDDFLAALPEHGLLAARTFPDHYRYSDADLAELSALARKHRADTFVTTEKDLVRLSPQQRAVLSSSARLTAARLQLRLSSERGNEASVIAELLGLLPPDRSGLL
jgi:tetraacyldisaccharide 4'-kinase